MSLPIVLPQPLATSYFLNLHSPFTLLLFTNMTRQSTRAATAASKAAVKPAKTSSKKPPPKTPAKSKGTGSTPASTAMATLRAKQKKAVDDLAAAEARQSPTLFFISLLILL